jgi:methanethiol oxidase
MPRPVSGKRRQTIVGQYLDGQRDITDPFRTKQVYEHKISAQVNIVSSSWDGKRVYFTSSLFPNWDKKGKDVGA